MSEAERDGELSTAEEVGVGLIVGGAGLAFGGIFLAGGLGAGLGLLTEEVGVADIVGFGAAIAGGIASGVSGIVTTVSSLL